MTADLQEVSAASRQRWANDHRHVPPESRARRPGPAWWQTCAPRELVTGRTRALPFSGDSHANLKTRERGLIKLLDWLEDQPGGNWQERWLASGAEEAGRAWMKVPMGWLAARGLARKYDAADLACGMIPLIGGQVIRPDYRWLLRLIPPICCHSSAGSPTPPGSRRWKRTARPPAAAGCPTGRRRSTGSPGS